MFPASYGLEASKPDIYIYSLNLASIIFETAVFPHGCDLYCIGQTKTAAPQGQQLG